MSWLHGLRIMTGFIQTSLHYFSVKHQRGCFLVFELMMNSRFWGTNGGTAVRVGSTGMLRAHSMGTGLVLEEHCYWTGVNFLDHEEFNRESARTRSCGLTKLE